MIFVILSLLSLSLFFFWQMIISTYEFFILNSHAARCLSRVNFTHIWARDLCAKREEEEEEEEEKLL
jgi:hypothetical protein